MKRCREIAHAPPTEDCAITSVVMGAQKGSGKWHTCAASSDTTAATAVRVECTSTEDFVVVTPWVFAMYDEKGSR